MNRLKRYIVLFLVAVLITVWSSPVYSFGLGDLINVGKQQAEQAVFEQIAKSLGEVEPPIVLDQRTAYKVVQVDNFQPQKLEFHAVSDWLKPLAPGDYWIDVMAYCTQWSIHSPGNGMAYKLAPLQGRAADIISAIFFRGTLQGVNPSELQAMSWRIQAGVSINQWSDSEKQLAHMLIPDYENRLTSDLIDEFKAKYESLRGHVPIRVFPSFDEVLGKLGTVGQLIASTQRARQTLIQQNITADQLPDLLYERTDGTPRQLPGLANPEPVQWNEVKPGLYASFMVHGGNMRDDNRLNIRVTPQAVQASNLGEVRVASTAGVGTPSQVSVLDALVTAKGKPSGFIRNIIVQTTKGKIPLGEATFLPGEFEAIPVFGQLVTTMNIGYAIGQHGAQALATFMRPAGEDSGGENRKPFDENKLGRPKTIDSSTELTNTDTWPNPPVEGQLEEGLPSRAKPASRDEKSLYDSNGGEWRPHKPDKYHSEGHWDYKPSGRSTEWQNIGLDGSRL